MEERLCIRWLGINGFEIRYHGTTVLIDPCVTRGDSGLLSDPELVAKYIGRADAIAVTHSHWDHLIDVPEVIRKTGARLYGSRTACNIARYFNVPESLLHEVTYRSHIDIAEDIAIDFLESRHMQPCSDEGVTYLSKPEKMAERSDWVCGEVFALRLRFGDTAILNIGSANLQPSAILGTKCDYLLCGISRWKPGFPELIAENIDFDWFIPTHHDNFKQLPLSQFILRDDFIRLRPELEKLRPATRFMELEVLKDYIL